MKLYYTETFGFSQLYSFGSEVFVNPKNVNPLAKTVSKVQMASFDKDGCFFPEPFDTAKCKTTVEEFLATCPELIAVFQEEVLKMVSRNIKICICTGRAWSWVERFIQTLFPAGIEILLVLESGADLRIYNTSTGEVRPMPKQLSSIAPADLKTFLSYKTRLEKMITRLGGSVETGKINSVSGNSPEGETTKAFYYRVLAEIERLGWTGKFHVSHSSSAVDITPKNSGKAAAMKKLITSGALLSVTDETNDVELIDKVTNIVLAPKNSNETVKTMAENAQLGMISEQNHFSGVNQMLQQFNLMYDNFSSVTT